MPNEAYLSPDEVILDELYVCPGRPNGHEFGKDMWRKASHNVVAIGWTTLVGTLIRMLVVKFRSKRPGTSIVICSVWGKKTLTFGNKGSRPIKTGYWLSIFPTFSIKGGQEGFMF